MKQHMLALLITINLHGMDLLKYRAECASTAFLYDLPSAHFQWDVNQVVQGKTMLDVIYLAGRVDADFIRFMRQRGARSMSELEGNGSAERSFVRIQKLLDHIQSDS